MIAMILNDVNDGFWLFGVLVFGLTRLIGHFGAFLLFPGFRFQPISRFLVLPGAWAWFSPNCDRLAFARRAYRTAEGEMDIQASPLRSYVLIFFVPLLSGGPGPLALALSRQTGEGA